MAIFAFIGIILLGLGFSALASLALGWVFMILVGIIHAEWLPGVPTIGYWWAVLWAVLIRVCTTADYTAEK